MYVIALRHMHFQQFINYFVLLLFVNYLVILLFIFLYFYFVTSYLSFIYVIFYYLLCLFHKNVFLLLRVAR